MTTHNVASITVAAEPPMSLSKFEQRLARARSWHKEHPGDRWEELYQHFEGVDEMLEITKVAFAEPVKFTQGKIEEAV